MTTLRPYFLICDFFQPWALPLTLSMNIPAVQFVVTGSRENFVVVIHAFKISGILFKILRKIFFPLNTEFFNTWNNHLELIMFVRSLREIGGKYLDIF